MIRSVVIVLCLAVSYFAVFLMIANHWGQALMYGVYGSFVFSLALFVTSCISRGQPWRVFWVANIALILLFGGLEIYSVMTLKNPTATRFGGERLWMDGHITLPGVTSIAFDIAVCTLANFVSFYVARRLIDQFNLQQRSDTRAR